VYDRLGFTAVAETTAFAAPSLAATPTAAIRPLRTIDEIVELDKHVFGGDRRRLLCVLIQEAGCRAYVVSEGDRIAGYLFARERLIGPGCAVTRDAAGALVRAAVVAKPGRQLLVRGDSGHVEASSTSGCMKSAG
jgi:hypothetical protein